MKRTCSVIATTALLAIATHAGAQDATPQPLGIGDPAPKIEVSKVVKGKLPASLDDGKVQVVEFWATWCGPCRTTMPHLTELQARYKDQGVDVIGIAVWQREPTPQDRIQAVTSFLESDGWPEKTAYTLAVDEDNKMADRYMRASSQNGIPTAFIVGPEGMIEWIGHPMSMDEPLAKVVAGDWDRAAAKAEFDRAVAWERTRMELGEKMMERYTQQDWDGMLEVMKRMQAEAPKDEVLGLQMQEYRVLSAFANRPDQAKALGNRIYAEHSGDVMAMNQLAWMIATDRDASDPDLPLALKCAEAGVKASESKDPNMLDTLATVQWEMGDHAAAIKTEKTALGLLDPDDRMYPEFEAKISEWEIELSQKR